MSAFPFKNVRIQEGVLADKSAYFVPNSDLSEIIVAYSDQASLIRMNIAGDVLANIQLEDAITVRLNSNTLYIDTTDTSLYLSYWLNEGTKTGIFAKHAYSDLSIQNYFQLPSERL